MIKTFAVSEIVKLTLSNLRNTSLSSATINNYRQICEQLARFCDERQITNYTKSVGERFIENKNSKNPSYSPKGLKSTKTLIDRLNCILVDSEWERRRKQPKWRASSNDNGILDEYYGYLRRTGKTERNISTHMLFADNFLNTINELGCLELGELSAQLILDAFDASSSKTKFRDFVSHFLKYLFSRNIIPTDFLAALPIMTRHKGVPSIYTPEEVEQILSSFDRETAISKRDYACTLIAARLGLRVSDIAELKFDNLRTLKDSIEIKQVKTKRPHTLPLLNEVKDAIYDYVDNARPTSQDEHVFLQPDGIYAVTSTSVSAAIVRAFIRSNIESKGRKRGAHALRASLATALLSEGNSYSTVQKALGHKDIQNVTYYAKTEIEKLRQCALPIPKPSGMLLGLLKKGEISNA